MSTAAPEFLFDKTRKNPGAGFPPPITGTIAPSDVLRLAGNEFVGFAQRSGKMWRCNRGERISLTLGEADWEIVSFAPVVRGVAVLGLADKLNSAGAVLAKNWKPDGSLAVTLLDGGDFVAWCNRPPKQILSNREAVRYSYDSGTGKVSCQVRGNGRTEIKINW